MRFAYNNEVLQRFLLRKSIGYIAMLKDYETARTNSIFTCFRLGRQKLIYGQFLDY